MEYYVLIINIGLKKTLKIHFSIPFWSFTHKMKMSREMEHALYGGTVLKAWKKPDDIIILKVFFCLFF